MRLASLALLFLIVLYFRPGLCVPNPTGTLAEVIAAADSLRNLGKLQSAHEKYQLAAEMARKEGAKDLQAYSLNEAGILLNSTDQLDEALANWQQAAELFHSVGDKNNEAQVLKKIGRLYWGLEEYSSALEYFKKSQEIAHEKHDTRLEAGLLSNIGMAYYNLGEYKTALESLNQSLLLRRETSDKAGEIRTLSNIGMVYEILGEYQKSIEAYLSSLEICRQIDDEYMQSAVLINLGVAYKSLRHYTKALECYSQALTLKQRVGDFEGEALCLNNIGIIHSTLGEPKEALDYFFAALAIAMDLDMQRSIADIYDNIGTAKESLGETEEALDYYYMSLEIRQRIRDRRGEGISDCNLGSLFQKLGEYEKALDYYKRDLEICRESEDVAGECFTMTNIGATYSQMARYSEAFEYLKQAMTIGQENRLVANLMQTHSSLALHYSYQGMDAVALQYYQKAIEAIEQSRGGISDYIFRTNYSAQTSDIYDGMIQALINLNRLDEAFSYVERCRARTFLDMISSREITVSKGRRNSQLNTNDQMQDFDITMPATLQADALDKSKIQALLKADWTVIEYYITDSSTYIWRYNQDNDTTIIVDIDKDRLQYLVDGFRDAVVDGGAIEKRSKMLFDILVKPVELPVPMSKLVIIPQKFLHYLPFSALMDSGGTYLGEKYCLSYLPSGSVLKYIDTSQFSGNPSFLGLANPQRSELNYGPLPFAEKEVNEIAPMFDSRMILTGADATEQQFKLLAGKYDVIHLACHSDLNSNYPLYSNLILSDGEDADGDLSVYEIFELNLQAELVALSGCQTGLGNLSNGDELVGLSRAFIFAGTPAVLASLWRVDDEATYVFMNHFYNYLKKYSRTDALRLAQKDTREEFPDCISWAPFILIGNPE